MDHGIAMGGCNKKMKMDPSEFRLQCRVSCGADHVIENLLPYLLPPNYYSSYDECSPLMVEESAFSPRMDRSHIFIGLKAIVIVLLN